MMTPEHPRRLRPAVPGDGPALTGFLSERVAGAMFPLARLYAGGMLPPGVPCTDPAQMQGWIVEVQDEMAGFLGLSGGGHLMPCGAAPGLWQALAPALRAALAGRAIGTVIGADGQAPAVLAALGLAAAPRRHQDEEPGFALDLAAVQMPDTTGFALAPLTAAQGALVQGWRIAYLAEVFGDHGAADRAAADVRGWIAAGSHRLLLAGGEPVALTGFNARIPGTVQVGGVWTPPESRGRGLARRAVALHLAEARDGGIRRAVLFAANAAAAAAYRSIGFVPGGTMGIVELAGQARVPPWR